jgi:hypothetical protein
MNINKPGGDMDAVFYLIGSTVLFIVGFYTGYSKGEENGRLNGFKDGINATLTEIDSMMKGGLTSPLDWEFTPSDASEYRNAGSIVIRVVYKGKSILLTGDIVGRHETESFPDSGIIAAEKFVYDNRFAIPINSDVLVASHH